MNTSADLHITSNTPLIPAIKTWQVYLNDQGRSLYTVKAFIGDLNLLARYLPPETTIGRITTEDLTGFLEWLQKERAVPCSPKSLSRRITSIKSFFRWLLLSGRIEVDPAEKILQQSVISPLPEVLTMDEQFKVTQVAGNYRTAIKPDARAYVLLGLLLTSGIKKGECLALKVNHLEISDSTSPYLYVRYANAANRYKERKISLSDEWIAAYHEYEAQYKPVDRVFPWSPRRLEYLLEDIGKEAGLTKHLSFDMCRWTCVLNDWRSGEDKEIIRQKLGISKIQWREIGMKLKQLSGN
jgi:site-specific recombinase XerD